MIILQVNEDLTQFCDLKDSRWKERTKNNNMLQETEAYCPESITSQKLKPREQITSSYQFVWKLMPSIPVGRAINTARHRLVEAGIPTAEYDAQIILAHVLQQDRDWIFANYKYELNEQQATLYAELIARKAVESHA